MVIKEVIKNMLAFYAFGTPELMIDITYRKNGQLEEVRHFLDQPTNLILHCIYQAKNRLVDAM